MSARVSVLMVEGHPIFREGLKAVLGASPVYRCVGEAGTGEEGVRLARTLAPELVLLALSLPDRDGVEVCRELTRDHPDVLVLVVSRHSRVNPVVASFRAGARGFVTKHAGPEELLRAMDTVMAGGTFLGGSLSSRVVQGVLARSGAPVSGELPARPGLSARELEVLGHLARGRTAKDVAAALGLSPKTVENHRSNLMRKLGAHGLFDLLKAAVRLGLVDPDLWG